MLYSEPPGCDAAERRQVPLDLGADADRGELRDLAPADHARRRDRPRVRLPAARWGEAGGEAVAASPVEPGDHRPEAFRDDDVCARVGPGRGQGLRRRRDRQGGEEGNRDERAHRRRR